jgi:hypothetical protein
VVPDRPLGGRERLGELGDARRPLAQEEDDLRPNDVGERTELLRVLDDEDVLRVVVDEV